MAPDSKFAEHQGAVWHSGYVGIEVAGYYGGTVMVAQSWWHSVLEYSQTNAVAPDTADYH